MGKARLSRLRKFYILWPGFAGEGSLCRSGTVSPAVYETETLGLLRQQNPNQQEALVKIVLLLIVTVLVSCTRPDPSVYIPPTTTPVYE